MGDPYEMWDVTTCRMPGALMHHNGAQTVCLPMITRPLYNNALILKDLKNWHFLCIKHVVRTPDMTRQTIYLMER
jgi:hypothetical protein